MVTKQFMESCRAEWKRINPAYTTKNQSIGRAFLLACRETVPGYFAPVRFFWWLAVRSWRSPVTNRGEMR